MLPNRTKPAKSSGFFYFLHSPLTCARVHARASCARVPAYPHVLRACVPAPACTRTREPSNFVDIVYTKTITNQLFSKFYPVNVFRGTHTRCGCTPARPRVTRTGTRVHVYLSLFLSFFVYIYYYYTQNQGLSCQQPVNKTAIMSTKHPKMSTKHLKPPKFLLTLPFSRLGLTFEPWPKTSK